MDCYKVVAVLISLARIVNVFVDYNYDHPDQYWQGPEIAFEIQHSYGFRTWEWTMDQPIRNGIYPKYLSLAYSISNEFHFSHYWKEKIIKFFQIILGSLGDYYLLLIIKRYCKNVSFGTCLIILTNHYYFSMMNRTYINSIETILSIIAFYYWHSRSQSKSNDYISRFLVILNFIIRPTSLVLFAVIWIYQLVFISQRKIQFIIKNLAFIVIMLISSIFVNSIWYGKLVFVQYNFLKYNIILKWSQLYGIHSFFYYFYASIPFILGPYLILLLYSMVQYIPHFQFFLFSAEFKKIKQQSQKNDKNKQLLQKYIQNRPFCQLFILTFISLIILSFSSHKQHRFLFILTPFLLILCIKALQSLKNNKIIITLVVVINLGIFLSLNIYGKTGGLQILRQIREDINKNHQDQLHKIALVYLCQPHSLPLYSILQTNISSMLLDTSPMNKLKNFNEQISLQTSPQALYKGLTKDLSQQWIIYLIIQQKYAMKGSILNKNYQFILENNFDIKSIRNKMNIFQQNLQEYDNFILLKKQ